MENLDYYTGLVRSLEARLEEMEEERKLVQRLLLIYSKRIGELGGGGKIAEKNLDS